jgi:hypothetical protein
VELGPTAGGQDLHDNWTRVDFELDVEEWTATGDPEHVVERRNS